MINQLNTAFEVIAVDGMSAYFVGNTGEGLECRFDEFEESTGLSCSDLEYADQSKTTVFIQKDGKHFTVGRIAETQNC